MEDHGPPQRELRIGLDAEARLLETVVLVFDSGDELVIHAITARRKYWDLLPGGKAVPSLPVRVAESRSSCRNAGDGGGTQDLVSERRDRFVARGYYSFVSGSVV